MEKIRIQIFPDGMVLAETLGIKGKKCEKYIPFIEKLTNARAIECKFTDEYYEENVEQEDKSEKEIKLNSTVEWRIK